VIEFNNICNEKPYKLFKDFYNASLKAGQKNIEAICIASYSSRNDEVAARFVNLKFINDKNFIFFSNYNSPKSKDFQDHKQITALFYWNSINVQIRMKAEIKKTSKDFNNEYFSKRDSRKNALAISSNQSQTIASYEAVKNKFNMTFNEANLSECPDYWGGFSFVPYYFEFWEGHDTRLNKREIYEFKNDVWIKGYLQP
tara:strand:- start:13866 stop:14462 length:597 start_codon:yes stop_codon:yes gene_type:complete